MLVMLLIAGTAKIAFVHHGNQSFSDNGAYALRPGDEGYVGNSYHRILDTHEYYQVPVDLHISGPLLHSYAWLENDNGLLDRMKGDLVDVVGGFYAEHIAPYVAVEMNHFALWYEKEILTWNIKPPGWENYPTVIWIPERVWKSEVLMPYSLIDVLNAEYGKFDTAGTWLPPCIVLDDNALYINSLSLNPHKVYKLVDSDGNYVFVVFIDKTARDQLVWNDISDPSNPLNQLLWSLANDTDQWQVVVYGDDWEKAAGVAGWDFGQPGAPSNSYDWNIKWIKETSWVQPVHVCEVARWWGVDNPSCPEISYDELVYATYQELHDWTGGTYDNWYYDFKTTPAYECSTYDYNGNSIPGDYEDLWQFSYNELLSVPDNPIAKLGWVTMMGMLYETAWHSGPGGELIYWGKNLWNHSRYGGLFAFGATWLSFHDTLSIARTESLDADGDGIKEYAIYNSQICAVFDKRGGRALVVFTGDSACVVGNLMSNWGGEGDWDDGGHPGLFHDVQAYNSWFSITAKETLDMAVLELQEVYDASGDSSWDVHKKIVLKPGKPYLTAYYYSGFTNWTKSGLTPDLYNVLLKGYNLEFITGITDSGWTYAGWMNRETGVKAVYLWGSGQGLVYHNLGRMFSGAELVEIGGIYGDYTIFFYAGKGEPEVDSAGPGDLDGPIIYGTAFYPSHSILPEDSVLVETHVLDPSGVSLVELWYGVNDLPWSSIPMERDATDSTRYYACIPPQNDGDSVSFAIKTEDSLGNVSWDNNNWQNYNYVVGRIKFVMDGELDRVAELLSENPDMHLWGYWYADSSLLYLATEAAGDGADAFSNDHFIFVSLSPSSSVPAPWAKKGLVGKYIAFLADENDNSWVAWYDSSGNIKDTLNCASGTVLEGIIRFDTPPSSIFVCVGTYETWDGGYLQWQVPKPRQIPPDTNIDPDEWYVIALTGIEKKKKTLMVNPVISKGVFHVRGERIKVYDVLGRKVWEGKGGKVNLRVPSGVYFMVNELGEKEKVMVIR